MKDPFKFCKFGSMQFRDRARHGVLAVFSSAIAVSCVVILLVASSDEVNIRFRYGCSENKLPFLGTKCQRNTALKAAPEPYVKRFARPLFTPRSIPTY